MRNKELVVVMLTSLKAVAETERHEVSQRIREIADGDGGMIERSQVFREGAIYALNGVLARLDRRIESVSEQLSRIGFVETSDGSYRPVTYPMEEK